MRGHLRSKDAGQDVADHAAYAVDGKDVEGIVNVENEFELGGQVAAHAATHSNDDGTPRGNETRGRRDGDQSRDGPRAEANSAPFLLQAVVDKHPNDATNGSREISDIASHDSADVDAEAGASVEPEPSNPEEDGAKDNIGDTVRAVWQAVHTAVSRALAEHDAVCEGACAGGDVDGAASCEVVAGEFG